MPNNSPGRPRTLDDTKRTEIVALVSAGFSLSSAARYVGCSPRTIIRERLRNPDFLDHFRKAEIHSSIAPLQTVQQAARTNWRAATWLLERREPQSFALTHRFMIDPHDMTRVIERMLHENRCCIPDPKQRARAFKRIRKASMTEINEVLTTRRSPTTGNQMRHLPTPTPTIDVDNNFDDDPPDSPDAPASPAQQPTQTTPASTPPPH